MDIRRVAEEAGVSTATVSRTMSGRGPVKEATRQRVLRAAERLNYQPSAAAQSLRTERTMIIGVLVPDLGNPVFVPFLRGVQHVAQSHAYSVLVVDAQRSAAIEQQALDRLRAQGVDALVLAGPAREAARVREFLRAGIVVMDPDQAAGSRRSRIAELELPGTRAMCEALAALGHRRVAYISRETVPGVAGQRRWRSMSRHFQTLGVKVEQLALGARRSPPDVAEVLLGLLRPPERVSALVCSTHGLAPSLLRGLHAGGIELPDDCSFVTYGDSEWAEAYRPALSVVTLDLYKVAVSMTTAAIRALNDERTPLGAEPVLEASFLRRDSVGAAARGRWRERPPLSFC